MLVPQSEAARLLRELAERPRQGAIWPLYHGRWSSNVLDAMEQGRQRLQEAGEAHMAAKLRWTAEHPGCCVANVIRTRMWPPEVGTAMQLAAGLLEQQAPEDRGPAVTNAG